MNNCQKPQQAASGNILIEVFEHKEVLRFHFSDVGESGLSAYELSVANGFNGTLDEWLESLVGPPVPVAQELGDDPNLAVSQKLLKDSIDAMESSNESMVQEAERLNSLSQQAAESAWQSAANSESAKQAAELFASKAASSESSAAQSAQDAEQSALSASSSSAQSSQSASESKDSANQAKVSSDESAASAQEALESAHAAKLSEQNALASEQAANLSAQAADESESNAKASEQSAASSAQQSADSAVESAEQAVLAKESEQAAKSYSDQAKIDADRAETIIRSVETKTDGRMTVRFTKNGQISYFYIVPQFSCEDIAPDGSLGSGPHPAFIFDGKVEPYILVAAYQAAIVDGEVVSQPGLDPAHTTNYDQALAACRENGAGWDLISNLDWAAIALWCMANGYQPRGNTYYGLSHDKRFLTGVRQDKQVNGLGSGTARTLTGSGGPQWNHDGLSSGVADMVGNVWEWVSGMKMVDGNVFLAAENGITDEELYVDTGFSLPASRVWSSVDSEGASDLVKQSLIAPASTGLAPNGRLYTNLEGERLPSRGGTWTHASSAGLAALILSYSRSDRGSSIGFRARFRDL